MTAKTATVRGCSIKIARCVENQVTFRNGAVRAAGKCVQRGFLPSRRSRRQFVNHTASIVGASAEVAALARNAVQVAGAVRDQAVNRNRTLGRAIEDERVRLLPRHRRCRREFIDQPAAKAPSDSYAEHITLRGSQQVAYRWSSGEMAERK